MTAARRQGVAFRLWLTLGGTLAREIAEFSNLDWRSRELSLDYAWDPGEGWSGSVRLGLGVVRFDEEDATFLTRREDRTRSAGLTLPHRGFACSGYQPIFALDWSRTRPTVPPHDREPLSFRIEFRRLF